MEGWRPFHSSYLSDGDVQSDNHIVEGNTSRILSKCVAWWNAENVSSFISTYRHISSNFGSTIFICNFSLH